MAWTASLTADTTERPITVELGTNSLVGIDPVALARACRTQLAKAPPVPPRSPCGTVGRAGRRGRWLSLPVVPPLFRSSCR